ncbi:LOW QUALITY PROTEIN: uncharacterized protein LOC124494053 [Dermatophagoides farinae]
MMAKKNKSKTANNVNDTNNDAYDSVYLNDSYHGNIVDRFHLMSNTFHRLLPFQELIRFSNHSINKVFINYNDEINELNCQILTDLKSMIRQLESSSIDSKINPNITTTVIDTPIKSVGSHKRKYQQNTPSSTNVSKIKDSNKITNKKVKKQKSTDKTLAKLLDKENDNPNKIQTSLIAKKSSIEDSDNKNNDDTNDSRMCLRTRARTRAQNKREQELQQSKNVTEIKNNNNDSTIKKTMAANASILTTPKTRKPRNKNVQQQKESNKKPIVASAAALGTPSAKNINLRKGGGQFPEACVVMATPTLSKQRDEEIRLKSAQKLEKAAQNRKMMMEQRQQKIRQRSIDSHNRLLANQQKQNHQKQQPKLVATNTTPSKQTKAFMIITGAVSSANKDKKNINGNNVFKFVTPVNNLSTKKTASPKSTPTKVLNKNSSNKKLIGDKNMIQMKNIEKTLIKHDNNAINNVEKNDKTIEISPIKPDRDEKKVNVTQTLINSTMTIDKPLSSHPIPPSPMLNKTILNIKERKKMTPLKLATTTTTLNQSPLITQYKMTPPPKLEESMISTYDISRYFDSDDEEEQLKEIQQRKNKRLPPWVTGRLFVNRLAKLYCQNEKNSNLAYRIYSNCSKRKIVVDIEKFGLQVIPKYRNRTSSIVWTTTNNKLVPSSSSQLPLPPTSSFYKNFMSEDESTF